MTGSGRYPYVGALAALGALVAVYLAGTQAVHFAPEGTQVATWWPAAGISVSLLVLAGRPRWPVLTLGIALAITAANITGGRALEVSVAFGLANAAEALVAGLVLTYGSRRARFESLDDFLRLVGASIAGAAVVATGGALTVAELLGGDFFDTWRYVWASHAASTLVIVPVALTLGRKAHDRRLAELAIQATALLAVTLLVFAPQQHLAIAFAPLPLLVWASLRLGVRALTWELLGTSVLVTGLTAAGHGPFAANVANGVSTVSGAGAMAQLWLLSAALMSLPLTLTVEQRGQLLDAVTAREELFRRNFTKSLTGMLLLKPQRERLEIVDANEAALRLIGEETGRLVGRYLDRVVDQPALVRSAAQEILDGHRDGWTAQLGLVDRPRIRVDVSVSLISGGDDPVLAAQMLDVTAEHHARARIEAAEQLTSATLDTAACIIMVADMSGTVVRVNAATCGLTGFSEDQILGRPVWETIVPAYRVSLVKEIFSSPDGAAVPGSREADVARADGGLLRVVWNNNIVFDDDGRAAYVVMTGIDVTAERTAAGLIDHLLRASNTTALVGIDHLGCISLFNSGASALLGWDPDEVVGMPFTDLLDPDELEARTAGSAWPGTFAALVESVGDQGETPVQDWTWLAATGARPTVSMTLSVAADAPAARNGFLCVGRDVTEQRHSQAMLITALETERRAVERLRKLDAAKDEFVSTVSHELRTPVTSIIGYTELLTDGSIVKPDPAQLPLFDTIARNGERLITICNDLLMIGELESGGVEMARETVDLSDLMKYAEASLVQLARGRHLGLDVDEPTEATVVLGDRMQLERVLENLLSNAVKFTEDGGEVTVRLTRTDTEARLTVGDTGIGIPDEEQAGLFQKFFRSSTAQAKAIQGAGLGLSIVSGIVSGHGGRVAVRSAHQEGTEITVVLPLHRT
ncbi:PAS domain S-box protein [Nocardioides sp.]|uniref:PAS domain S-box protein n=1 Tax=Nocardioides sp. TaxID=35761 RepID=UPI002D81125F|nr:PAS domain S-box protein [Nocardioides sp.]HET8961367.1 PAS domain S-box protein [Nocardioides sp.]